MDDIIPTELIGLIPRNPNLIDAYTEYKNGKIDYDALNMLAEQETIQVVRDLGDLGRTVISDGEQRKFAGFSNYCLHNSQSYSKQGLSVDFADRHKRVFAPYLKIPPFKYEQSADEHLKFALQHAHVPVKQAVIFPSMLTLVYTRLKVLKTTHTNNLSVT